jgi:hypothetical protein
VDDGAADEDRAGDDATDDRADGTAGADAGAGTEEADDVAEPPTGPSTGPPAEPIDMLGDDEVQPARAAPRMTTASTRVRLIPH